jgi:phosphate-selective porin OprO/OprP
VRLIFHKRILKLKYAIYVFVAFLLCNISIAFGSPNVPYDEPSDFPIIGLPDFQMDNHRFHVNYSSRGLIVARDDTKYIFNIYGNFEADFLKFVNSDNLLRSGTNIRYATLYFTGLINKAWQPFVSYSFNLGALLDASIIYHGFKNQYIQVGQFTPNVGFANWAQHVDINFLEWPLPVYIFSPGYPQGVHYNIYGRHLVADASIFSGSTLESYSASNPIGATGRIFLSPVHKATRALHFGVSNWWQRPNDDNTVIFGTTPEATSHEMDVLVTTGFITNVNYYDILSGEFASVYGPLSFQTEYYLNTIKRQANQSNLNFSGYYATLGYFLTGESMTYAYPLGIFTTPSSINGKYGAFQVLVRYSTLDLIDKDVRGGKEYNVTFGLNWFVNHFVTFKLNIIRAVAHPAYNGKNINAMIYAARAQMRF